MFERTLAYAAACGVVTLGLAFAPQAGAVTITGSLAGDEDGLTTVDLLSGPHNFNAAFVDSDTADLFKFNFENSTASSILISLVVATINQTNSLFFSGGVETTFGTDVRNTAEKDHDSFSLTQLVDPGDTIMLAFDFGDPNGATNADGDELGPDIDFNIEASVIPLPAGLVLFLSGLAGVGFLGRYKAKRRELATS